MCWHWYFMLVPRRGPGDWRNTYNGSLLVRSFTDHTDLRAVEQHTAWYKQRNTVCQLRHSDE
jgi:hypothetical protein